MKKELFLQRIFRNILQNRLTFSLYLILGLITVSVIVLSAISSNWMGVFNGVMTLILFLIPPFLEETLKIKITVTMEVIALLFIFASQVLGEIAKFYVRFWFWDDLLHAVNGLLFASFGFALAELMNRKRNLSGDFSPFFLALVACCFSLSIGVLWEFFEFSYDMLAYGDMQKDMILKSFASGYFSMDGQTPIAIKNVVETNIVTADGTVHTVKGGYLDLGIVDTMKDLFVDLVGALLASISGYFYLKRKEQKWKIDEAKKLHPATIVGQFAIDLAGGLMPVVEKENGNSKKLSENVADSPIQEETEQ